MMNTSFKARLVARAAVVLAAVLAFGLTACDNPAGSSEETSFIVAFDSGGAGDVESQTVDSGGKAARPPNLIKTGHGFGGWYLSLDSDEAWDFATNTVSANITLYAKWTTNQYTVTFNSDGGGVVANQSVAYGGRIAEPEAPVKGALILEGWYKESARTTKWDFDADTVTGNTTLYAKWVDVPPGHFLVAFNSRSGSAVESQFVADGGKVVEPEDPTRANYVFDAWYKEQTTQTAWNFDTDTITATTTLYAGWIPLRTVTFNTQSGSAVDPLTGVVDGDTIERPAADPEREGFRFMGWHKTPTGPDNVWDFATDTVTADTTIYARWTALYTVTFNSGEGGSVVAPMTNVLSGSTITAPTAPTLTGSTFAGWHRDAAYNSAWDFATDTVVANTPLYAKWTVTVTFNANGGNGAAAPETLTLTRGSRVAEPEPEEDFNNPGKTFMGWFKESAGTTAWDFADPVNVHTTLYAKWEFVPVTGIANGPVDGIFGEPLNIDAAAVEPPNASYTDIVWTVATPGAGIAAGAKPPFVPTTTGTVVLTATVAKGGASGANFTRTFSITVTDIRPVESISITGFSFPAENLKAGTVVDLNKVVITPVNATNKTIVWTVKTPGAGITAPAGTEIATISPDKKLTLTRAGTPLVLTATIDEKDKNDAPVSTYTHDFSFEVDNIDLGAYPGGVDFGDDTFIKLYANGTELLSEGGTFFVEKGTEYYVSIDGTAGYTNTVWRLNGIERPLNGGKLILDTSVPGPVTLTVEAKNSSDLVDDGVYTFIIKE